LLLRGYLHHLQLENATSTCPTKPMQLSDTCLIRHDKGRMNGWIFHQPEHHLRIFIPPWLLQ
jgi:hypothetical protein